MLAFEHDNDNDWRISNNRYCIPNVEIKDYNVMIDRKNFFNQPVKNDKVTYENITKNTIGQGEYYTTVCLLDYAYFKKYYKTIAIDLSKQQILILKQFNKLILQQIYVEKIIPDFISFLMKQKKLFLNFQTEL